MLEGTVKSFSEWKFDFIPLCWHLYMLDLNPTWRPSRLCGGWNRVGRRVVVGGRFGGNLLTVAGGTPLAIRENLMKTFEPWDFILPTFFVWKPFCCDEFQCWPFLWDFMPIKAALGMMMMMMSDRWVDDLSVMLDSPASGGPAAGRRQCFCLRVRIKETFWGHFCLLSSRLQTGSIGFKFKMFSNLAENHNSSTERTEHKFLIVIIKSSWKENLFSCSPWCVHGQVESQVNVESLWMCCINL